MGCKLFHPPHRRPPLPPPPPVHPHPAPSCSFAHTARTMSYTALVLHRCRWVCTRGAGSQPTSLRVYVNKDTLGFETAEDTEPAQAMVRACVRVCVWVGVSVCTSSGYVGCLVLGASGCALCVTWEDRHQVPLCSWFAKLLAPQHCHAAKMRGHERA